MAPLRRTVGLRSAAGSRGSAPERPASGSRAAADGRPDGTPAAAPSDAVALWDGASPLDAAARPDGPLRPGVAAPRAVGPDASRTGAARLVPVRRRVRSGR